MALCHECGSEVAENDIFCPFCGISLEPISLGGTDASVEFEKTVVMPLPVKPAAALAEKAGVDKSASNPKLKITKPKDSFDVDKSGNVPADNAITVTDPPEPEILRATKSDDLTPPNAVAADLQPSDGKPSEAVLGTDIPEASKPAIGKDPAVKEADADVEEPELPVAGKNVSQTNDSDAEILSSGTEHAELANAADTPEEKPANASPALSDVPAAFAADKAASFANDESTAPSAASVEEELELSNGPYLENAVVVTDDDKINYEQNGTDSPFAAPEPVDESAHPTPPEPSLLSTSAETIADKASDPGFSLSEDVPRAIDALEHEKAPPADGTDTAASAATEAENDSLAPEPKVITNDIVDKPGGFSGTGPVPNTETVSNPGGSDTDGKKSSLKPLGEGTVLNARYEIVRKIGGGGMGAVYLAFDKNLGGVERAVKEMVQLHLDEDQQQKSVDDFKRESMILSTLDHPSIPTIYDYFYDETESRFYLVMKYISGGDLASRLRAAPGGRIDEKTVTEWALQVADVLAYLHGLPTTIVYRDLKPSNVMIDGKSGRVMLIDFGIARSINQAQEKGMTAVGTMGYAPQELYSGHPEPRSDVYSLGATMFHLLTGADPQNNPLLIFDFQKNPRPRQINPQLSDQMERILMRSVEYNAEARFVSATEMRHVLRDHLENLKMGKVTYGVTEIPSSVSLANQNVFCGFCGQRIVATDLFCAFCGAKQPIAQQGVHSEIYSRTAPTAKLVIDGTSELDAPAFSLEKNENLVGRRDPMSNIFPEVDLSKYDPQTKISRRHARIWSDGGNFMVEDLGSSNGTVLIPGIMDAIRLMPHQPHTLSNGDRIRVGDTTLHFLVG